jgi:hypothetical protein
MKDSENAWNDRGSKHEQQGSETGQPSKTIAAVEDSSLSYHLTAPESAKIDSQDTGENPS